MQTELSKIVQKLKESRGFLYKNSMSLKKIFESFEPSPPIDYKLLFLLFPI